MDTDPAAPTPDLPSELLWLLDAPLFIDDTQVDAFYDAVLRPDYEETATTLSSSVSKEKTFEGGIELGVALPWFGKAGLSGKAGQTNTAGQGSEVTLNPISNAYRHLIALALHYATTQEEHNRLVVACPERSEFRDARRASLADSWLTTQFIEAVPRALVFLEIPPRSRLIPAALELANGEVTVLAEDFGKELAGKGAYKYPGSTAEPQQQEAYFQWFAENFDDRVALKVVERAVRDRQIAWIDYNVALAGDELTDPPFMHLHLVGHGTYDTGVFGYNFIVRGFNYGLRIVGTLKSGPDLNVLAVFER